MKAAVEVISKKRQDTEGSLSKEEKNKDRKENLVKLKYSEQFVKDKIQELKNAISYLRKTKDKKVKKDQEN